MATLQRHALGEVVISEDTQPEGFRSTMDLPPDAEADETSVVLNELVLAHLEPASTRHMRAALLDSIDGAFQAWGEALDIPAAYVLVFGSVRLDLQLRAADTDCLCVASTTKGDSGPLHSATALRDMFFTSFPLVLQQQLKPDDLQVVRNAIVPVIKLKLRGLQFDIAFAVVPDMTSPRDVDGADIVTRLRQLGQADAIEREHNSIAGVRGGEAIARAVPSTEVFWVVARTVKYWAMRRGVYGGVYGYLGGGAIAIMVASTCQRYPLLLPPGILRRFFSWFARLLRYILDEDGRCSDPPPPTRSGMRIAAGDSDHCTVPAGLGVRRSPTAPGRDSAVISITNAAVDNFFATVQTSTWKAKGEPRLYVVNPVYPYSNNTRNVTPAQLRHLRDEFERASDLLVLPRADSTAGPGASSPPRDAATNPWRALAARADFLRDPRHVAFVHVGLLADTQELFGTYGSLVGSRMRMLPGLMEAGGAGLTAKATCGVHLVAVELAPRAGGGEGDADGDTHESPADRCARVRACVDRALAELMNSLRALWSGVPGVAFPLVGVHEAASVPGWLLDAVDDVVRQEDAPPQDEPVMTSVDAASPPSAVHSPPAVAQRTATPPPPTPPSPLPAPAPTHTPVRSTNEAAVGPSVGSGPDGVPTGAAVRGGSPSPTAPVAGAAAGRGRETSVSSSYSRSSRSRSFSESLSPSRSRSRSRSLSSSRSRPRPRSRLRSRPRSRSWSRSHSSSTSLSPSATPSHSSGTTISSLSPRRNPGRSPTAADAPPPTIDPSFTLRPPSLPHQTPPPHPSPHQWWPAGGSGNSVVASPPPIPQLSGAPCGVPPVHRMNPRFELSGMFLPPVLPSPPAGDGAAHAAAVGQLLAVKQAALRELEAQRDQQRDQRQQQRHSGPCANPSAPGRRLQDMSQQLPPGVEQAEPSQRSAHDSAVISATERSWPPEAKRPKLR